MTMFWKYDDNDVDQCKGKFEIVEYKKGTECGALAA